MSYVVNGVELETGEENFLLEADFGEEVVGVIAAAEGLKRKDLCGGKSCNIKL